MIQLKSPKSTISLNRSTNAGSDKLTIVTRHQVITFRSFLNLAIFIKTHQKAKTIYLSERCTELVQRS